MDKWVGDTIRAGSYSGCVWWDSVSFTYGAFIEHVVGTKHGARYTALRVLRVLWTDKVTFQGQRRSRKMLWRHPLGPGMWLPGRGDP